MADLDIVRRAAEEIALTGSAGSLGATFRSAGASAELSVVRRRIRCGGRDWRVASDTEAFTGFLAAIASHGQSETGRLRRGRLTIGDPD